MVCIFQKNGFGEHFEVRARLLQSLGWTKAPKLTEELPSYNQFAYCFRRGAHIPFCDLLKVVLGPAPGKGRVASRSASHADLGASVQPWTERLRPRLRSKTALPPPTEGELGETAAHAEHDALPESVTESRPVRHFVHDIPLTTLRPFPPRKRAAPRPSE